MNDGGRDPEAAREAVADLGRELLDRDLTTGTGGTASVRIDAERVAISPSGVPYREIDPSDVPVIDLDGERVAGDREPSSEHRMHVAVYRARPGVGGVVHTHSPYATARAVLGEPIPPTHYLVPAVGEEIPVAPYETWGTAALAERAVEALDAGSDACLLEKHGVLAVGETGEDALGTAELVEFCARVHHHATAAGDPAAIPDDEVARLRESFGR